MRVFKTRLFARLVRKFHMSDASLCEAVWRAEQGLIHADIGRFMVKQRIARPGEGRRGGYRAVLFYRSGDLAVFLTVFAKSAKANLTANEEDVFRKLSDDISRMRSGDLRLASTERGWIEVDYEAYGKEI